MKHRILSLLIAGCTAVAGITSASIGIYSQAEESSSSDTVRIMAVGDSITDGYINGDNGYRKYFCYYLQQAGVTNFDMVGSQDSWTETATYTVNSEDNSGIDAGTVITYDPANEGYSGYSIKSYDTPQNRTGIYETLFGSSDLVETYDPDIIMLQIGTNDILDAQNDGIADRLEELVDKILPYVSDDGEMLFLASIPDIDISLRYDWLWVYGTVYGLSYSSDPDAFTEKVQESIDNYNAAVKALVEEKQAEGQHIQFADIHSVVDVSTGLYDGVHPNESGYACMGKYWSELILSYLNDDTPLTTTTTSKTTTETVTTTTETTTVTTTTETTTKATMATTTTETTEATTETTVVTSTATSDSTSTTTPTVTTTEESTTATFESTAETTVPTEAETTSSEIATESSDISSTESTTDSTTTTGSAPTQLGDVNGDGSISVADAVALSRFLVQDFSLTYDAYLQADQNQDQILNALDLSLLRQLLLKYV